MLAWRAGRLDPTVRGMLWSGMAGLQFVLINTVMRELSIKLGPFETQFLRYLAAVLVLIPLVWRSGGLSAWMPLSVPGQFARGALHAAALYCWFFAVPHVSIADITAITFTGPLFIMLGASLFLGEPMRAARWAAAVVGMLGVLMVVGPQMQGQGGVYLLMLLASSPVFAASFLLGKALSRHEKPSVIVAWQSLTVMLFSLPGALLFEWRWPDPFQWLLVLLCGMMGSTAHYCMTRSFKIADISATQSVKFLDLLWASLLGWAVFGDIPAGWTLVGGVVIATSTLWLARHEARGSRLARSRQAG